MSGSDRVFRDDLPPFNRVDENRLYASTFEALDTGFGKVTLGVAAAYGGNFLQLDFLAFADSEKVIVILLSRHPQWDRRHLLQDFLINKQHMFYAFDMDRLCLSLFSDANLRIKQAVDIQSALQPSKEKVRSFPASVLSAFPNLEKYDGSFSDEKLRDDGEGRKVAERAWAAFRISQAKEMSNSKFKMIDTSVLEVPLLRMLARTFRISDKLEALKPDETTADFNEVRVRRDGQQLEIFNNRYKTRLKPGPNQSVVVQTNTGKNRFSAKSSKVSGKLTTIKTKGVEITGDVESITVVGKEDPTRAQTERRNIIMDALLGGKILLGNFLVRSVWLDESVFCQPMPAHSRRGVTIPLNPSQSLAVDCMLGDASVDYPNFVLVQGPPGTGKTATIAAVVQGVTEDEKGGLWLIAHSNVAVKNIGEKLASIGFFDWKLLVSTNFHFDWHEHLYEKINPKVIASSRFPKTIEECRQVLGDCKVILCTLSMLSNPLLSSSGFLKLVPVEMMIIDEASQIELGDYLPVFTTYSPTLRKICFIGDNKQLAPFGEDNIVDLKSIFEVPHFQPERIFLNVQYRMPPLIGDFISRHVYGGRLQSNSQHEVQSPLCCRFVDVAGGRESKAFTSWKNEGEVQAIVRVVQQLVEQGREDAFKVITPYQKQHDLIENALRNARLPWKDKCFVLDSFQGNEADYVIISLVRTASPGFIANDRRANVLLTRCRKGMAIISTRPFLKGIGKKTLVGRLAEEWDEKRIPWINSLDIIGGEIVFGL